jgi:hypothetical protein
MKTDFLDRQQATWLPMSIYSGSRRALGSVTAITDPDKEMPSD